MSEPHRYRVGDPVRITPAALAVIEAGNRSVKVHPSSSFVEEARRLASRTPDGVVTHVFPPGYEFTASFGGTALFMKPNWVEPGEADHTLDPAAALSAMADRIVADLAAGKSPTDIGLLGNLVGAIRRLEPSPAVVFTVSGGVAEVRAVSGTVRVVHADMDRDDGELTEADVDEIVAGKVMTGSREEFERELGSVRSDLEDFVADATPTP